MRVPLISGIAADNQAEFRTSLPINLEIVPTDNRIAKAQFRAPSGARTVATGTGPDRGATEWGGKLYRVMGTQLVRIDPDHRVTALGEVGGTGPVTFDQGFDRLALRSGDKLFYLTATGLVQVTDPDLGPVLDMLWIDGYYMTTDGTSIVVTELSDPMKVEPLKYGSAEEDPDMVTGLIKFRNEAYALGRYTIQVLANVGKSGFPFATQKGASIPVGCVGPHAKCLFADTFAFVGSARNEGLGVYLAGQGSATRISSRLIDDELAAVADPTCIHLENRTWRGERRLLVHLPGKTLVFLANATKALEEPVWYIAQSGRGQPYRVRNAVMAYGKTYVGDTQSAAVGVIDDNIDTHFGEPAEFRFDAGPIYNEGRGGILQEVELIGLPGRAPLGAETSLFLSMTRDGQTFSIERPCSMGRIGDRGAAMKWRPRVRFEQWVGLRFRGIGPVMPGIAALEVQAEPLSR